MSIKIKCSQEQKEELEKELGASKDEVIWEILEYGSITDEELDAFGIFTEDQKLFIKEQYSKYPKDTFPNPMCALY